ncbi:hypothetical protein J6590_091113 [Homalodisca vitripennis]|nr:hypothetical protein J6590_091113 [Homalodisca vitripennis]
MRKISSVYWSKRVSYAIGWFSNFSYSILRDALSYFSQLISVTKSTDAVEGVDGKAAASRGSVIDVELAHDVFGASDAAKSEEITGGATVQGRQRPGWHACGGGREEEMKKRK